MDDKETDTLLLYLFFIACILVTDPRAIAKIGENGNAFAECLRVATEGE